jgi:prepilin-type N-terminal cleavage/methylation domain-containing protein
MTNQLFGYWRQKRATSRCHKLDQALQKGFTLMEVTVATAVTGILIIIIMDFMSTTIAQGVIDTARSDLLREAQISLDTVNNDIRLSASTDQNNRYQDNYAPLAPDNLLSWQSDNDTLILATAARDTDNNVIWDDALHYISQKNNNIYFLRDKTLYRRTLAAPLENNKSKTTCPSSVNQAGCPHDSELAHNVESFTVRYFNNDNQIVNPLNARSIEISLKLKVVKYGQPITANYTTRTVFRNE